MILTKKKKSLIAYQRLLYGKNGFVVEVTSKQKMNRQFIKGMLNIS